jgi:hypothetical protein
MYYIKKGGPMGIAKKIIPISVIAAGITGTIAKLFFMKHYARLMKKKCTWNMRLLKGIYMLKTVMDFKKMRCRSQKKGWRKIFQIV